jgi:hypothetical protein
VPARILAAVANGVSFEVAFEQATGRSLVDAEHSFHAELTSWTRRLPFLTSPSVLWMIVTLLALFAIYVRYRRSAIRRRKWAEEDARDAGWLAEETLADETPPRGARTPPRDWVH